MKTWNSVFFVAFSMKFLKNFKFYFFHTWNYNYWSTMFSLFLITVHLKSRIPKKLVFGRCHISDPSWVMMKITIDWPFPVLDTQLRPVSWNTAQVAVVPVGPGTEASLLIAGDSLGETFSCLACQTNRWSAITSLQRVPSLQTHTLSQLGSISLLSILG